MACEMIKNQQVTETEINDIDVGIVSKQSPEMRENGIAHREVMEVDSSSPAADKTDTVVKRMSLSDEASFVLSILYGLLVVILAIVFKVSESISAEVPHDISKNFLIFLFSIAVMWLLAFKIYTNLWYRKNDDFNVVKSPHASNRWLKGVVALFGFAIIVKDSLEVIAVAEITNENCQDKLLYFIRPIFHSLFTGGQVVFLFFYAKIHIQDFTYFSRFGIMHAMATNLAVWINIISDETNHALEYEREHHDHGNPTTKSLSSSEMKGEMKGLEKAIETYCNNTYEILHYLNASDSELKDVSTKYDKEPSTYSLFSGNCTCVSDVCQVIARADKFLSPLLIEFCLVTSCLLYMTWSNVGKERENHHCVARPSHRFYKSYKGVVMGTLALLATVILLTVLASVDSGVQVDKKNYFTEHDYLIIYETYLVTLNTIILITCGIAFYVFSLVKSPRRTHACVGLDIVLLFICLVGPFLVDLFSILALFAGTPYSHGQLTSLFCSFTDITVSVLQILLIIHGLSREPGTGSLRNIKFPDDKTYSTRRSSVQRLGSMQQLDQIKHLNDHSFAETSFSPGDQQPIGRVQLFSVASEWNEEEGKSLVGSGIPRSRPFTPQRELEADHGRCNSLFSAPPKRTRIILRDVIMFLVLSNTCLWMFLSLNGTAFKMYTYPYEFFGHSAWTTLASVTAPLIIFLKLHSAACFFEIWSYS